MSLFECVVAVGECSVEVVYMQMIDDFTAGLDNSSKQI